MAKRRSGRSRTDVDYSKLSEGFSDDDDDFIEATPRPAKKKVLEANPRCNAPQEKPKPIICEKYVYIKEQPISRLAVKENVISSRAQVASPVSHRARGISECQILPVTVTLADVLVPIPRKDNGRVTRVSGPDVDSNDSVCKAPESPNATTRKYQIDAELEVISDIVEDCVRTSTGDKSNSTDDPPTVEEQNESVKLKPQPSRKKTEDSPRVKEKVVADSSLKIRTNCNIATEKDVNSPAGSVSSRSSNRPIVAATKWKAPGPASCSGMSNSPSGPGVGLRLGLSRNMKIKPLHSNVKAKH